MMKILVLSDSHGSINECMEAVEQAGSINGIIHLGDLSHDAEDLSAIYPNIPIEYVTGNNEFGSLAPYEKIIMLGGKRVFITHGHHYRVKSTLGDLYYKAKVAKLDLVLYGHTHFPNEEFKEGVWYVNPGSIRYMGSYCIVEIIDNKIKISLKNI